MFAGVGERTREGNDLYREMIESGERSGHSGQAQQAQQGCSGRSSCEEGCQRGCSSWWRVGRESPGVARRLFAAVSPLCIKPREAWKLLLAGGGC